MKYVNAGNGKMPLITLIAILSISLTINLPGLAVSPILAKLRDSLGCTEMESQLVTSLPNLFMIPFVILAGRLSRGGHSTAVLVVGLVLFLIAGIVCLFADSMMLLIVMGCIIGVGCGLVVPIAAGWISKWFMGRSRQEDLGLKSTVSNAMIVVANLYAGWIARIDWHLAFAVYLIPIIPLVLVPFMTQRYILKHRVDENMADAAAPVQGAQSAPYHFQGRQSIRLLIGLIVMYMLVTFATTSVSYYLPFTMDHYGMDTSQVGLVTSLYYGLCAFSGAVLGSLKRFFGRMSMYVAFALCALGLFGIGFTHSYIIYLISTFIMGFGYGIFQPILYNKTTYVAPDRKLGTQYFSYVLASNYVAIMMVPFVDSFFKKVFHSSSPGFVFVFSGVVVVGVLIWAIIARKSYDFEVNPATAAPGPAVVKAAEVEYAAELAADSVRHPERAAAHAAIVGEHEALTGAAERLAALDGHDRTPDGASETAAQKPQAPVENASSDVKKTEVESADDTENTQKPKPEVRRSENSTTDSTGPGCPAN